MGGKKVLLLKSNVFPIMSFATLRGVTGACHLYLEVPKAGMSENESWTGLWSFPW